MSRVVFTRRPDRWVLSAWLVLLLLGRAYWWALLTALVLFGLCVGFSLAAIARETRDARRVGRPMGWPRR